MVLTVGGIQLAPVTAEPATNLANIKRLGRVVKDANPELSLLVFPEFALTGYRAGDRFGDLAEIWQHGPYLEQLAGLAAELEVVLVVGFAEGGDTPGPVYDAAGVFDRDGTPVKSYRKTHCLESERHFFANGDELLPVETSIGALGVMICWDAAIPEVARVLALSGADLLVTIGAWEDPYAPDWELATAARAYDNVLPHIAVNRTGTDLDVRFSGHSSVFDCLGHPLGKLTVEEDGFLVARVDFARTEEVRAGYGTQLRDRRPELYSKLSEPVALALSSANQRS